MVNRFSVPKLKDCTIHLSKVASNKIEPDLILKNAPESSSGFFVVPKVIE